MKITFDFNLLNIAELQSIVKFKSKLSIFSPLPLSPCTVFSFIFVWD